MVCRYHVSARTDDEPGTVALNAVSTGRFSTHGHHDDCVCDIITGVRCSRLR